MQFLGVLGNLRWWRCEGCHLEYSTTSDVAPDCCAPAQDEWDDDLIGDQCIDQLCDCDCLASCTAEHHAEPSSYIGEF